MMVGAMIQVSTGEATLGDIKQLLVGGPHTASLATPGKQAGPEDRFRAPGTGLTLISVKFKEDGISTEPIASPYSKRGVHDVSEGGSDEEET